MINRLLLVSDLGPLTELISPRDFVLERLDVSLWRPSSRCCGNGDNEETKREVSVEHCAQDDGMGLRGFLCRGSGAQGLNPKTITLCIETRNSGNMGTLRVYSEPRQQFEGA